MERAEMSRKKSIDILNLPDVPTLPTLQEGVVNKKFNNSRAENSDQLVVMLNNLKEREASFYKTLSENVKLFDSENVDINQAAEMSADVTNRNICEDECREYIAPLMSRTQGTISALISTKDSLDQLDNLHRIIQHLLTAQEQNYQMRKRLRTVKTLNALKEMEFQVSFFTFIHFSSIIKFRLVKKQKFLSIFYYLFLKKIATAKKNLSDQFRSGKVH